MPIGLLRFDAMKEGWLVVNASKNVVNPIAAPEWTNSYPLNFFFKISFSIAGFALPPVDFITWPTKKPNNLSLPDRYSATLSAFAARIASMAFSMAPVSVT